MGPDDMDTIMQHIKDLLVQEPRKTIAVAESLTCGRLQQRLGDLDGATRFFMGGMTVYTEVEKIRLLSLPSDPVYKVSGVSGGLVGMSIDRTTQQSEKRRPPPARGVCHRSYA